MNKQKVKAFTIMELTVVMLIASIVIGMAYSIYTIVVRSHSSFNNKNKDMAGIIRLDELLKRDFSKADLILKDQNAIILKSTNQLVNYKITPNYIVRTSGITDSFKVQLQSLTTFFEGQPVTEIATEEEQNRIDDMEIDLLFEKEKIPYHYHKLYSSANLIQRKANAVN